MLILYHAWAHFVLYIQPPMHLPQLHDRLPFCLCHPTGMLLQRLYSSLSNLLPSMQSFINFCNTIATMVIIVLVEGSVSLILQTIS